MAAGAATSFADDIGRIKAGDFNDSNWRNDTTNQSGVGPPGAGDNMLLNAGESVTASGGTVQNILGQGPLILSGGFNCSTVSEVLILKGKGTLTAGSGGAVVDGGNLAIGNFSSKQINVTNKGTVTAGTLAAQAQGAVGRCGESTGW